MHVGEAHVKAKANASLIEALHVVARPENTAETLTRAWAILLEAHRSSQRVILAAEVANAEFAAGMTALAQRITPPGGGSRMTIAAISADGRWGYEREDRYCSWVAFRRDNEHGPTLHARTLDGARRATFEHDHPMHGPECAPRPVRIGLA